MTVIADRYEGKRLNSPNDVVVRSDGTIWFTDPIYGISAYYEGGKSESEIGSCNVYQFDPADRKLAVSLAMTLPAQMDLLSRAMNKRFMLPTPARGRI